MRWHEGYTERQVRWFDMLAERFDLAPEFLKGIQEQHRKVKTVMSPGAVTVTEDIPAREVARLMYAKNIKRVPVVRAGTLVGIVARSDLIRALAQKLGEEPVAQPAVPSSVNEALRRKREEAGPHPRGIAGWLIRADSLKTGAGIDGRTG